MVEKLCDSIQEDIHNDNLKNDDQKLTFSNPEDNFYIKNFNAISKSGSDEYLSLPLIREYIYNASSIVYNNQRCFLIIKNFDQTSISIQNHLLKYTEEFPGKNMILFLAKTRSNIANTILSRSFLYDIHEHILKLVNAFCKNTISCKKEDYYSLYTFCDTEEKFIYYLNSDLFIQAQAIKKAFLTQKTNIFIDPSFNVFLKSRYKQRHELLKLFLSSFIYSIEHHKKYNADKYFMIRNCLAKQILNLKIPLDPLSLFIKFIHTNEVSIFI